MQDKLQNRIQKIESSYKKLIENRVIIQKKKIQNSVIIQNFGRYYFWVPRGSILGPLLFNIFWCDLFYQYENNYFAKYADDTSPYIVADNNTEVLTNLSSLAQKTILGLLTIKWKPIMMHVTWLWVLKGILRFK